MTSDRKTAHALATRCIHAGNTVDPATGAVMPSICTSTTYRQPRFNEPGEFVYSRASNPTRDALERCVADLESGARALAFSSGQAATAAALELLAAGDHIVAPADLYGGTLRLFNEVRAASAGLEVSYADFLDREGVAAALRDDTRMIWIETPTNPLLKLIDIEMVVELVRERGGDILICVDNTFATPCFQRPLELGCDLVMHSATKYLGGHSDVLGGLLVAADPELGRRLVSLRSAVGSVIGPFDAYLVLRGIKTLSLRMERHTANALAIASSLESNDKVARVFFPGLASHPQSELAMRQMDGFGGVVTIELASDIGGVERFMNALELFTLAESLGGVESLAGHPATMSHSVVPPERRQAMGISDSMVRLSVGIERARDLIDDLRNALDAV